MLRAHAKLGPANPAVIIPHHEPGPSGQCHIIKKKIEHFKNKLCLVAIQPQYVNPSDFGTCKHWDKTLTLGTLLMIAHSKLLDDLSQQLHLLQRLIMSDALDVLEHANRE